MSLTTTDAGRAATPGGDGRPHVRTAAEGRSPAKRRLAAKRWMKRRRSLDEYVGRVYGRWDQLRTRREIAALEAQRAVRPDPLAHASADAAATLRGWVCWAWDRADARGPLARQGAEALGPLLEAVEDLEAKLADGAANAAVDDGFAAIFDAITAARCAATNAACDLPARHQARELDELPLASAARGWCAIEHLRREARDGWIDPDVALAGALAELRGLDVEGVSA